MIFRPLTVRLRPLTVVWTSGSSGISGKHFQCGFHPFACTLYIFWHLLERFSSVSLTVAERDQRFERVTLRPCIYTLILIAYLELISELENYLLGFLHD